MIFFVLKNDPQMKSRTEDALIAWTWKIFMENPDRQEICKNIRTRIANLSQNEINLHF